MSKVQVGDVELYYEEHGSGDPLVLIMGLATDSQGWLLQTPELSKHYRTLIFDNRGVGRSSKPPGPYSIHQMADDAAGLMGSLEIDRAHVAGVSMGGMIAQELALRHPERVRSLVLGCTYPEPDEEIEATRAFSISELGGSVTEGGMKIDISAVSPMAFLQNLLPKVFNAEFIRTELPQLMKMFGGALQWGFSMEAILGQVEATMAHKTTDRLHEINVPTLVITGDADLLIPPHNSDLLAERIPGAKLVKVEGGSHAFNFETPDVFNRHVLDFLATVAT